MTPAGVAELLDVLSRAGALAIAILVIIGFYTGRIVSKGHLTSVEKQRDEALAGREADREALLTRIAEDVRLLVNERMKRP